MHAFSGIDSLIPLPEFPQHINPDVTGRAGLRRFGIFRGDLNFDFSSADRASLVTRLLASCAVIPEGTMPDDFFLELTVGKRIECLLMLAANGQDAVLEFPSRCTSCGEEIEFELTVPEISAMQRDADQFERAGIDICGRRTEIRKPTGRDQEQWSRIHFSDQMEAALAIIHSLADLPGSFNFTQPEELDDIENALDGIDPLVDFSCGVHCGVCGEMNEYDIDLTETALNMLKQAQVKMFMTVHRLASHYSWSEEEIFAVPDWRRRQYLELIEATGK